METIEANLKLWIERHTRFERQAQAFVARIDGRGHTSAEVLISSQVTNLAARIVGLTEAFIDLANADRVYAAPSVVRSLYESCCVPCYMARELLPRLRKRRTKEVHRLLYRLGVGTGPDAGFGRVRPIQVPALNKAANAWIDAYFKAHGAPATGEGIAHMIYGPLSDQTHPNWGALYLGMTIEPGGRPRYTLRPLFDEDSIDELLSATAFMLMVGGAAIDEVMDAAIEHPTDFPPGEPAWQDTDLWPSAS